MPKYQVEITKTAESDLRGIYQYISSDTETAAGRFVKKMEQQIVSLEKFPLRCPVIPEAGELGKAYRHLVSGNYRTVFKIDRSRVVILRVIHSAQLLNLEPIMK